MDIPGIANRESDVAGYNVYFNYTYEGTYERIGSTSGTYFVDLTQQMVINIITQLQLTIITEMKVNLVTM